MADNQRPVWARSRQRLGAFVIDGFLLGAVGWVIGLVYFDGLAAMGPSGRLIGLVVAVAYFGYCSCDLGGGRTVGMRVFKLRVVGRDGRNLLLLPSLVRALILVLPLVIHGVALPDDDFAADKSGLSSSHGLEVDAFNIFVSGVVGGIGLAQIFLFVFNRPSRRLLHDLIVGTSVVTVASPMPETPPPNIVTKSAFAIVAATLLLVIIAPHVRTSKDLTALKKVQQAVAALPRVAHAAVSDTTTFSDGFGHGPQTTRMLLVAARLREWPIDPQSEIGPIGRAVVGSYHLAPEQHVRVRVYYGFDIGIASGWKTFTDDYPTGGAPRRSQ